MQEILPLKMYPFNLSMFCMSKVFFLYCIAMIPFGPYFNPIALSMAKTLWSFGHSECNRVKETKLFVITSLIIWKFADLLISPTHMQQVSSFLIYIPVLRICVCLVFEQYRLIKQAAVYLSYIYHIYLPSLFDHHFLNPIALRKAKIVYNFGLSECNRVKEGLFIKYQASRIFAYIYLP